MNMEAIRKTIEGEISRLQRAADALRGNSYSGVNTNHQGRKSAGDFRGWSQEDRGSPKSALGKAEGER